MHQALPLACFLSMIRPPGVEFENALLQIAPVNKDKCPLVRERNDVSFQLYTRHNPISYQELQFEDDEALFASNIDFHVPTVIYFHAFMETPIDGSAVMIREAYMLRGDTNFIIVDAQRLEAGPWYLTAAGNTWYIGKFAAQFIDYLVSRGLDLSKTHLIGHSLGGQSAGVAGSSLKSGRVSRITALDPALPLFSKLPDDQKLDASDAEFVDVIHTDAGIFGYPSPLGHADFYPNGGISPQPGCELEVVVPQQQLLNKCDENAQPNGYYVFHLKPHKPTFTHRSHFLSELEKFFAYIEALKSENTSTGVKNEKKNNMFSKKKNKTFEVGDKSIRKDIGVADSFKADDLDIDDQRPEIVTVRPDNYKEAVQRTDKSVDDQNDRRSKMMEDIYQNVHLIINEQWNLEQDTAKRDTINIKTATNKKGFNANDDVTAITLDDVTQTADDHKPKSHVSKRQKRFISLFKKSEAEEDENFLFKMLNFLLKNRKNIVPVYTVVREINTLVKSAQGELNHSTKEKNNFIGAPPILTTPVTYTLELGNESKLVAFTKRLLGLAPKGDRLTIGTGK